ncbi:hypothetical protein CRD17_10265 [Corynebacterium sp. LK30]|nr:hypothetical protein [Corynebacterium sp. LK30]
MLRISNKESEMTPTLYQAATTQPVITGFDTECLGAGCCPLCDEDGYIDVPGMADPTLMRCTHDARANARSFQRVRGRPRYLDLLAGRNPYGFARTISAHSARANAESARKKRQSARRGTHATSPHSQRLRSM